MSPQDSLKFTARSNARVTQSEYPVYADLLASTACRIASTKVSCCSAIGLSKGHSRESHNAIVFMVARGPKAMSITLSSIPSVKTYSRNFYETSVPGNSASLKNSVVYLFYGQKKSCTSYFRFIFVIRRFRDKFAVRIHWPCHACGVSVTGLFSTLI